MPRIIHVGTQTQGRTNDAFFDYRHIRSWEGGVEDEWLERNPGGWLQHRASVGQPPNHLYTARPQDVDALAYEWGREQGRAWKAIRDDGRSIYDRTRHGVLDNEPNIEAVHANWGYRAGRLWSDDEHKAMAWMFAHIWLHAARGWLEEVPGGTFWIPALSPNGMIADGLGPGGVWRPELSIWAAFGETDIRVLLGQIQGHIGVALHTYGNRIRPGEAAWSDPAVRMLCPPELMPEGGAYGGSRIEHALACMRQYGLVGLFLVMVGEWNRLITQTPDDPNNTIPVPPDWPEYLALVKRYAPGCPFTASQVAFSDRELARWEYEALVRRTVSQFPDAEWGPWLLFGHLFEDDHFMEMQMANVVPVLALKVVEVTLSVDPPPDNTGGGGETMPADTWDDLWNSYLARLAGYPMFAKVALRNDLGGAMGGEYDREINGETWRVQEFVGGLVIARVGDWANAQAVKVRSDLPLA